MMPTIPGGTWRMLAKPGTPDRLPKGLDAWYTAGLSKVVTRWPRRGKYLRRADKVLSLESTYMDISDAVLKSKLSDMAVVFRRARNKPDDLNHALAMVREASRRTLEMMHYKVQVAAALAMTESCLVELATGEGKTLVATMPAIIAGWRGRGCHLMTSNDYLAKRDAEEMSPLYRYCGVSVAYVDGEMDPPARKQAYAADITTCTNKEAAADFLRDRLALGRTNRLTPALLHKLTGKQGGGIDYLVTRGLDTAIVDEADSILIDEAVTPLIISSESDDEARKESFIVARDLGLQLAEDEHYNVNHQHHEVRLNRRGEIALIKHCEKMPGLWQSHRIRCELVTQALTARHLFIKDQQYVIQYDPEDEVDKVIIVDESTGRLMPDRSWRAGLHQAVEAKEEVPISPPKDTLARLSFQRFFRLYRNLSGMTGTAWEAREEMYQIYRLPTVQIPTNKPCMRLQPKDRVFTSHDAKWQAVVDEIVEVHKTKRPVLVGTTSVEASDHLSELLTDRGIEHQVLNAVHHEEEAAIVAESGKPGHVTVATNMAGRGTDIKLGKRIPELGGLHVIATERNMAGRIDRQLFGRAGRQGDPGSAICYVSLDDALLSKHPVALSRYLRRQNTSASKEISGGVSRLAFKMSQRKSEKRAVAQRKGVLKSDDWLDENLGFAGPEG